MKDGIPQAGDEKAVEQSDGDRDHKRERNRQIDRDPENNPHHRQRIGGEPVHRAEGQVNLADHDHEREPDRHDGDRTH